MPLGDLFEFALLSLPNMTSPMLSGIRPCFQTSYDRSFLDCSEREHKATAIYSCVGNLFPEPSKIQLGSNHAEIPKNIRDQKDPSRGRTKEATSSLCVTDSVRNRDADCDAVCVAAVIILIVPGEPRKVDFETSRMTSEQHPIVNNCK